MKLKRNSLLFAGLLACVVITVSSSIVGTLAWYAYSTRVTLSYTGTSIRKSEQLQVGIQDSNNYLFGRYTSGQLDVFEATHNLELDRTNKRIWAQAGSGLTSDVITAYLSCSPYAVNKLPPTSSREHLISNDSSLDDLVLYDSPSYAKTDTYPCGNRDFVLLPLCFRILDHNDDSVENQNIWITAVSVEASGELGVRRAIRTFFKNKNSNTCFLLNPSSTEEEAGKTYVAGVLDLKGDGAYDYYMNNKKEIMYGDYTGDIESKYIDPSVTPAPTGLANTNINNYDSTSEANTFLAEHNEDAYYINNYTGLTLKYAEYDTIFTVKPNENAVTGLFEGGKPVARTSHTDDPTTTGIGFTDLKIYLEGWDHGVVDKIIDAGFNLGLQFEIDRV